jgi:hypothetical protein
MTSEEIRKKYSRENVASGQYLPWLQIEILIEIAAQIAEANELQRFEMGIEELRQIEMSPFTMSFTPCRHQNWKDDMPCCPDCRQTAPRPEKQR